MSSDEVDQKLQENEDTDYPAIRNKIQFSQLDSIQLHMYLQWKSHFAKLLQYENGHLDKNKVVAATKKSTTPTRNTHVEKESLQTSRLAYFHLWLYY